MKIEKTFEYYNHLGNFYPYYFKDNDGKFVLKENLKEIHSLYPNKSEIDVTALIEIFNKNYILGNRTLIKGIYRSPWMAKPNKELTEWEFTKIPSHKENNLDEKLIAENLFKLICQEIAEYIGDKKNVGILLSGGMDSRISAGALDHIIKTNRSPNVHVCALTWGNENSRDVVYAKKIASRLGWEWKHYTVKAEDFLKNINIVAERGCEYTAVDLHAIPQITEDNELDVVLAGSYGDSVGRAEYSGIKVRHLQSLAKNYGNFGRIIKDKVYKQYENSWLKDIEEYHKIFPQEKTYQQYELDYQLHYMRRMLNPCMELINEKMPFFQVFTKPEVVEYMWNINPDLRTDKIYSIMFDIFSTKLDDIPWARTGKIYNSEKGIPDNYTKSHHSYHSIMSKEAYPEIKKQVLSENISHTGIFNMEAIESLVKLIHNKDRYNTDYLERLTRLASFSKMIGLYNLTVSEKFSPTIKDRLNGIISKNEYKTKVSLRKLFNKE